MTEPDAAMLRPVMHAGLLGIYAGGAAVIASQMLSRVLADPSWLGAALALTPALVAVVAGLLLGRMARTGQPATLYSRKDRRLLGIGHIRSAYRRR